MVQRNGDSVHRHTSRSSEGVLGWCLSDVIQSALSNQRAWWYFGWQWLPKRDTLQEVPNYPSNFHQQEVQAGNTQLIKRFDFTSSFTSIPTEPVHCKAFQWYNAPSNTLNKAVSNVETMDKNDFSKIVLLLLTRCFHILRNLCQKDMSAFNPRKTCAQKAASLASKMK